MGGLPMCACVCVRVWGGSTGIATKSPRPRGSRHAAGTRNPLSSVTTTCPSPPPTLSSPRRPSLSHPCRPFPPNLNIILFHKISNRNEPERCSNKLEQFPDKSKQTTKQFQLVRGSTRPYPFAIKLKILNNFFA